MKPIRVFVEGVADKKFLEDYFFYLTGLKLDDVRSLGGYSMDAIRKAAPQFLDDKINLLIVDADYDYNGGTYASRKAEIELLRTELKLTFSLFLFPNDKDNGDLEKLLCGIIAKENQAIFDCWDGYEICLSTQKKGYTTPATKTKVYGYLEALVGQSKSDKKMIKEEKRDYLNEKHWNLKSSELDHLRAFLKAHIID